MAAVRFYAIPGLWLAWSLCLVLVVAAWDISGVVRSQEPNIPVEKPKPTTFRLADGTEIPVEEWGETYEAWERAPILETAQARVVAELPKGDARRFIAIKTDSLRKRLYWLSYRPGAERCQIGVVNYDGSGRKTIIDRITEGHLLAIDSQHSNIYWSGADGTLTSGYALYRAKSDGTGVTTVVRGLRFPRELSIDLKNGVIYLIDQDALLALPIAGGREKVIPAKAIRARDNPKSVVVDTENGRLICASKEFWSMNLDGSESRRVEVLENGFVRDLLVDSVTQRLYWADSLGVCRAAYDGTMKERVTDDTRYVSACRFALDSSSGDLFWLANNGWSIVTGKTPPLPKKTIKPAPPQILRYLPGEGAAVGESLRLSGSGFRDTTNVFCVSDVEGTPVAASFTVEDDHQLTLRVPKLPPDCKRFAIIVRTASGATVTLPADTSAIQRVEKVPRGGLSASNMFLISNGGWLVGAERCVCFVERGGQAQAEVRGAMGFVRDGGLYSIGKKAGNVVYCEPFADVLVAEPSAANTYIRTPAIRASLIESIPAYRR